MKKIKFSLIIGLVLIILGACSDERDNTGGGYEKGDEVNEWIEKVMRQYYLWEDEIPDEGSLNQNLEPDKFFETLLSDKDGVDRKNGEHQYFSYIEKKSTSTKASSSNTPSYGFEFATYTDSQSKRVYALVLYTLPNSPASTAGLKRGDWISAIDNTNLSTSNYKEKLISGNAASFSLVNYSIDSRTFSFDRIIDMPAAQQVENTPFLHDEIIEEGGKKIGYLVYNTFRTGPGGTDDLTYDDHLKSLFQNYKANGVTEFILDLRYNGGGLISCAQLLTSLLAPQTALSKTFCILEYNGKQKDNNYTYLFNNTSSVKAGNLNLSRLYVLTGEMTASASELVINALIPHMKQKRNDIILVGDTTIGKYVGSSTYGENEDVDWLLHPITVKIFNADKEAEYKKGFFPDYLLEELNLRQPLYPFGDRRELLLSRALAEIGGFRSSSIEQAVPSSTMKRIYNSLDRYKDNGVEIPTN